MLYLIRYSFLSAKQLRNFLLKRASQIVVMFFLVNTIGIQQANKVMLMAAVAYNLKKYLKFTAKTIQSMAKSAEVYCIQLVYHIRFI